MFQFLFQFLSFVAYVIGWLFLTYFFISFFFLSVAWFWYWRTEKHEAQAHGCSRILYSFTVGFVNLWSWVLLLTEYVVVNGQIKKLVTQGESDEKIAEKFELAPADVQERMIKPIFVEFSFRDIFSFGY